MKKSRFTESQIVAVLKEGEAGLQMADVVAGAVMRSFKDSSHADVHPDLARAVERLISASDERTGYGINQVIAWQAVRNA